MGLNDETEKTRNAIEWLTTGALHGAQYVAAREYLLGLAAEVQKYRSALRTIAALWEPLLAPDEVFAHYVRMADEADEALKDRQ